MFMRKSNKIQRNSRLCLVFMSKLSIIGAIGLLLVGCGKDFGKFCPNCNSQQGEKSIFSRWDGENIYLELSQGQWSRAYEIIDDKEFFFYEARFTATMAINSYVCFYDFYMESIDQESGTMYFIHTDPNCDYGLVKFTKFTDNPHGFKGLHLSDEKIGNLN